ncbi:MAG: hypothetical protein ACK6CU_24015 [Deltaproteobacteria bacterium]|jgi:hypothetical protein
MIGSGRIARLLALRERVREAERASEHTAKQAHERAVAALEKAHDESHAALAALESADAIELGALTLLAQRRGESLVRERQAEKSETLARGAHEAQRARRYEAERDVKLAELARDRAVRIEAADAERHELRTADDRTASVRRQAADDAERRAG